MSPLRGLENRIYRKVRDPAVREIDEIEPVPWSAPRLREHKYCLLSSYRINGKPVHTPVWFGIEGDGIYVRSGAADGKIKRIRRNPEVLVTPCTARGAPLGASMRGRARIIEPQEYERAEGSLMAHYGLGRMVYRLLRRRTEVAYIQVEAG